MMKYGKPNSDPVYGLDFDSSSQEPPHMTNELFGVQYPPAVIFCLIMLFTDSERNVAK
jgi:hypothetical protein